VVSPGQEFALDKTTRRSDEEREVNAPRVAPRVPLFSALHRFIPAYKLDRNLYISLCWPLEVKFTPRSPASFPAKTIGNNSEAGKFLRNIRHERKHLILNLWNDFHPLK